MKRSVPFAELKIGEVFTVGGHLYVKVQPYLGGTDKNVRLNSIETKSAGSQFGPADVVEVEGPAYGTPI